MAAINIKSFAELVSDQVTAIQARTSKLVDFSIGSILRSLAESNAGVAMWIQQLIVKLLVTTRAATCSGEDLDSWMADFGFTRLSAVQATGLVNFSRFTATNPALIPEGTQVTTTDGSQSYYVIADKGNKAWDANLSGYVVAAGVSTVTVMVRANTAGASGNAQKGMVCVITGSVPYVDTVTNTVTFTNGKDAESDDDYRARFVLWIASLSKATKAAIGYAIASLQQGVTYTLTENYSKDDAEKPGYFYAVVDDGTGKPSRDFLDRAYMAIDAVRGFTVTFSVFAPEVVNADVTLIITTEPSADHTGVVTLVKQAVTRYIDSLSLGKLLAYTQLIRVAYGASPSVTNITALTVNQGKADLVASHRQVIRPHSITVS
ncbi:baseplate J/gp47 family protein [Pantoea sp. EA-12]|uniref:baseplate J/gp47 family protein n=1 Tax=Pantoea sp. EA-12 TaxID=3043303 RepID=UPI0024B6188A|nr:baseplate J/gp47 family protein [Pantoea sp. EA-12]MDI9222508.1 baseplate J/gp47 family protein [Pantoea sp. EA-12]